MNSRSTLTSAGETRRSIVVWLSRTCSISTSSPCARIADAQHHREAIELRLGQRVDAFLLDRVLRRQHPERIVERERGVGERHLPLLHRLEQRALRLRRRAVDLVGEQDVREDRPLLDPERRRLGVVDARAEDVGRQQVGRELHALELRRDRLRQRRRGQRLGDAGHAFEQQVAAARARAPARRGERNRGEERRQHPPDQRVLADDDLADLVLEAGDDLARRLRRSALVSVPSEDKPQSAAIAAAAARQRRRIQVAILRRRAPADEACARPARSRCERLA